MIFLGFPPNTVGMDYALGPFWKNGSLFAPMRSRQEQAKPCSCHSQGREKAGRQKVVAPGEESVEARGERSLRPADGQEKVTPPSPPDRTGRGKGWPGNAGLGRVGKRSWRPGTARSVRAGGVAPARRASAVLTSSKRSAQRSEWKLPLRETGRDK